MINDDDYNEIKELVDDYEKSLANGIEPFLDVDDTIDIAQYYDDRGETDKARRVLEHGLSLHPGEPEIISFLVRISVVAYYDIKKGEQYARMMNRDEHNIDYILAHTDILIAKGRFEEANDMVRASLAYFNTEQKTDLFIELAQMYVFMSEYEEALKWLQMCPIKNSRDFLELHGEVLMRLNQGSESEAVYNKLLDMDAFSVDYWDNIAMAQMSQHKVEAAKESVAYALAIDANDFQARLNQAHILFYCGQVRQARELMDTLIEEYKTTPEDKRDTEFTYSLYSNYVKVLVSDDKPLKAIEYLNLMKDDIYIFDAHHYDITRQLVVTYITIEKYDEALRVVKEMIDDPDIDDYSRYKVLEGTLQLCNGDTTVASKCFLDALKRAESTVDIVYEIGVAYHDCGYYRNCINMLTSLIDESRCDMGYGYIADCHKHLGEKKEYLEALKTACEVCPDEVAEAFNVEIPVGVLPSDYYNYVISHDDKSNGHSRKKKND